MMSFPQDSSKRPQHSEQEVKMVVQKSTQFQQLPWNKPLTSCKVYLYSFLFSVVQQFSLILTQEPKQKEIIQCRHLHENPFPIQIMANQLYLKRYLKIKWIFRLCVLKKILKEHVKKLTGMQPMGLQAFSCTKHTC